MNIGVVGVNHNITPIEIRESVSFTDIKKIEAINYLLDKGINEVIILSTCNRSEIYIQADEIENKLEIVKKFYVKFFNKNNIREYLFEKTNIEAINHIFTVAAGLDSIVLGEDQILGQVKDAHEFAMSIGSSKKIFNKLFREAVTTSKEIKSTTKISQHPLSISYIGVKFLKEKLSTLENKKVLIVGVGKMSMLAINHLIEEKVETIYVANRSYSKCAEIQDKYKQIIPVRYEDRYEIFNDVDIVISATASPHVVIKYEEMPKLNGELYMMDIALPRDIDTNINSIDNVYVYDIDDLKNIQNENDNKRKELASVAYKIIEEKSIEFVEWLDSMVMDSTIQSLNTKCSEIREDTLSYIFNKIEVSTKEKMIIDKMITSALKRLIREPIVNMKQVKDRGKREEYIKVIEELFEIQ